MSQPYDSQDQGVIQWPHLFWVLLTLIVGLCLRAIPLLEKQYFTGDELRAYLAATAHQGEYRQLVRAELPPVAEWAPVEAWTRLVHPKAGLGLAAVAQDLAWYDVHPPLYFWLLHLWSHWIGVTFWAGALLNLLLEVLILAVLVVWGKRLAGKANDGLWWGAIWWLSPLVIRVAPLTRQYVLLTLLVVLFAYALESFYSRPGIRSVKIRVAIIIGILLLFGMLTHYLFSLVIVTTGVILVAKYSSVYRWRLFYWLVPLGMAAALFVWIYPDFLLAFTFLREARPDFWSGMGERFGRTLLVNFALYLPVLVGLLVVVAIQSRASEHMAQFVFNPRSLLQPLIAFAWLPAVGVDLLYLLLISPHHAMGPHYVYFSAPFVAWGAWQILRRSAHSRWLLPLYLAVLLVINLALLHPRLRNFGVAPRLQSTDLATDGVIVFDHPASIHWLNFALHLPAQQSVYVAQPADLLASPERWLPRLQAEGGLYLAWTLSNPQKATATAAEQAQLLHLIGANPQIASATRLTPLGLGELLIFRVAPAGE